MSLVALTACTNDDFDSKQIAEETSPIQFEVINNDATTRASMNGNTIAWNTEDGDLFTLYHGSTLGTVTGFQNATYTANKGEAGAAATLTTPSMILPGGAIMVWPVDTTFRIGSGDNLTLKIPADQENIEDNIPYVSDLIEIEPYAAYSETAAPGVIPTAYKTAGKGRKYQVYMRPMASQLNLKSDYAGSDDKIAELYEGGSDGLTGEDAVEPIKVESVELFTKDVATTPFTKEIPVKFTAPTAAITTQWACVANNRKWNMVTDFNIGAIAAGGKTAKLTTKVLTGNESCKFLILPQATMSTPGTGVAEAGITVNTIYGKVVIQDPTVVGTETKYTAAEIADAWYRFLSSKPATDADGETTKATKETSGEGAGKYKCTSKPEFGLKQTLNGFSAYTASDGIVKGEPVGAAATRYVKVLLSHLDMSGLHVKSDKQLRDAARVWKKMGLPSVTVYLDGGTNNVFVMTQKTIKTINDINAAAGGKFFSVQPCDVAGEKCNEIWITGGGTIQDMTFIVKNGTKKTDVVFPTGDWKWDGTIKIAAAANTGINEIINRANMENAEGKILNITAPNGTTVVDITFVNDVPAKWNITAGTIRVQNDVRNNGTINISKGAQYRQDGAGLGAGNAVFTNDALGLPKRFGGDNRFGKINNSGVFATISDGVINNYGLIEHADKDAKTYITSNETAGADFTAPFAAGLLGNMKGRINLPYSNKDEDNISVSASLNSGFISVTVDGDATDGSGNPTDILNASVVGERVNYIIINSGIKTISAVSAQVKYLEIADKSNNEIVWGVVGPTVEYTGLIVLSDVNIKLNTSIFATVTYLGKDMYVGGKFNISNTVYPAPLNVKTEFNGYYGNTSANEATQYITY